jgi:hypothetical protein
MQGSRVAADRLDKRFRLVEMRGCPPADIV